jgi:DNA-binding HxlR family transcriptional regulator
LFRKGVIDVILYLDGAGEAGYYDTYKQGFVVSRQSFSDVLKLLEGQGLVLRRVEDGRPPRVYYSLSARGKRVVKALKSLGEALT